MRSFTVGKIWDIPIRINTSLLIFLPLLAWLIGSGQQIELYAGFIEGFTGVGFEPGRLRAGLTPWIIGITAAVGLFVSVTLHELGHSWVALRYDIEIESITLWILGGMAALSSIPKEWNREFWIAIAGPITSFLVAAVCYVGAVLSPESLQVSRFIVGWLAITNLTLGVFNLLPAFPMDGGRILRALLARSQPYATATRTAGRIGVLFAFLFAIVGVLTFQLLLLLLALFIYGAATTESRAVVLDELLEGITVDDVMSRDPPSIDADATVEEFGSHLLRDRRNAHLVVDGGAVVGIVTLADLQQTKRQDHSTTRVGEIARDVPRVTPDDDAFDTLALLNQAGASEAIVELRGEVVGTLTQSDYGAAISIRKGFQSSIAA
ncbi:site-2 protease family protein [Halolamina sp.]|jgi:Zn-dependent protease|uniref:site-2 protease family protein n=1 Tax=Halolamina sp. TaxID=1940283 RepID=UPI000223B583|nr:peptidase M50 [halophilic archaeon DL31]